MVKTPTRIRNTETKDMRMAVTIPPHENSIPLLPTDFLSSLSSLSVPVNLSTPEVEPMLVVDVVVVLVVVVMVVVVVVVVVLVVVVAVLVVIMEGEEVIVILQ